MLTRIDGCIESLEKYKSRLMNTEYTNLETEQSADFLYRNREILYQLDNISEDINTLFSCMDNNDYSLTSEEKELKIKKAMFIHSITFMNVI